MKTLRQLFDDHRGRLVGKIDHFFDDYESFLSPLRREGTKVLEIGVHGGGSLELWKAYFGAESEIHGLDIDPATQRNCPPGVTVHIGSQDDRQLLARLSKNHGPFDLVIDDGSHVMAHQIASFEALYPAMSERGVYICEDAFTSYWPEYGGGLGESRTFVEYAKRKLDELHAHWIDEPSLPPTEFTIQTRSVTFLSGAVVFQRARRTRPVYIVRRGEQCVQHTVQELHKAVRRNLGGGHSDPATSA